MKDRILKMVSLMLVFTSVFLCLPILPVAAATLGTDGNGFTWQSDDGVTCSITGYTGSAKNITIPSFIDGHTVTSIENNAFKNQSITSVTIPNTVISIGGFAFYYCTSLASVMIPNSVTSIGESAFAYCTSLSNVTLPNNLDSIDNCVFQDCKAFTSITIPSTVKSIGIYAFLECFSLRSITIPNSITTIGEGAFKDCKVLNNVVMPDSVKTVGNYLFYNCTSLSNVRLSNYLMNTGNFIFYRCTALTGVTLPNSLTNIGNSAFEDCTSLRSITIPNSVKNIGYRAFIMCQVLENVTIPNSVRTIDFNAFAHCYTFTNIVIPDSVTSIGDYAFYYCKSLSSITISRSVTSIGFLALDSCSSNLVIKGYSGSCAQSYAASNSLKFYDQYEDYTSTSSSTQPSQAQTSQGQTSQGQASQGQTSQGQTSQGQTSQGQTSQGQTSQGQTSQGQTSQGQTSQGQTSQSRTSQGQYSVNEKANNNSSIKTVHVSITPSVINLNVGDTQSLTVTVSPTDAMNNTVIWSSSNESVATVDSAGVVKAKAIGSTTITAKAGTESALCVVTVANNMITLNEKTNKLSISADRSVLNGAVKLTVTDISGQESGLNPQYVKKYSVVYCFDANLEDISGEKVEPTADIPVTIQLTPSMLENAGRYQVIYIDDNGVVHEIQSTIAGNYLVFTTNHFSRYAIVMNNIEENKAIHGNNTEILFIIAIGSILFIVIGTFVFLKKRKALIKSTRD